MTNDQAIALLATLMAGRDRNPVNFLADASDLLHHAERMTKPADEPSSMTDVDWNPDCELPF